MMKIRISRVERLFFTEQISLLLSAGVSVVPALTLLLDASQGRGMQRLLTDLKREVESGVPISSYLRKRTLIFSPLYVALIEVGEISGKLPETFAYLAIIERRRLDALRSIRKAVTYPLMVLGVSFAVLFFILIAVVPTFESLYASSGTPLPLMTRRVIAFSDFLLSQQGAMSFVGGIFVILFLRYCYRRKGRFRQRIDRQMLKLPIFGVIFQCDFNAGFSQVIGMMLGAGVPLIRAIAYYRAGLSNLYLQSQLSTMEMALKQGRSFHEVAQAANIFTDVALAMIAVGEVSGTLVPVFDSSANYHAERTKARVEGLIALIDPVSLVFIGAGVGVILVALYLPLFSIGTAL